MSTVFISYRRETSAGEARALYNDLVAQLGHNSSVFMDVDSIALGRDFRSVLRERLASCDLVLVLISRDWANVKDERGRTRLEDPGDFVRLEIEMALKRDIVVTPVLVQGAQMPTSDQLPAEIRDLAYRNGFELGHTRWESDVREMIRRLNLDVPRRSGGIQTDSLPMAPGEPTGARKGKSKKWRVWLVVLTFLIVSSGGGLLLTIAPWSHNSPHEKEDGFVALGAFDQQAKTYPNFRLVSDSLNEAGVKSGDIMKAKTSVYLRTNTENTEGKTNPPLGTIPEGGCVRILDRLDNIRGQTWAAVKQLANCG
jgi:hypothetical protein